MTERERLIEILNDWGNKENDGIRAESIADYLLQNGVIVLPCKVGDKVFQYDTGGRIYESQIMWFYYDKDYKRVVYDCDSGLAFSEEAIGVRVYLSREEAEKALKELKK